MIELKNISLYYYPREEFVLRDISWHIRPGERWVLFGRNGSGKTRLLEIITGYSCSSGGSVFRFGGAAPVRISGNCESESATSAAICGRASAALRGFSMWF